MFAIGAMMVGSAAFADQPGKHPHYLHALSDLRWARANIEKKGGDAQMKWDESAAVAAIDGAIKRLKDASIDDGKNLDDHPKVDAKVGSGRLHRGLEGLQAAKKDVNLEEDNAFADGLRAKANGDIDTAILRVKEGLCNAGDKSFCPK